MQSLQVIHSRKVYLAWPQRVQGLNLVCELIAPDGTAKTVIVQPSQAVDTVAFTSVWRSMGGMGQGIVWEDGEVYKG